MTSTSECARLRAALECAGRQIADGNTMLATATIYSALGARPIGASHGVDLIALERRRQIDVEGWTPEHDDALEFGEMACAAAAYACNVAARGRQGDVIVQRCGAGFRAGWFSLPHLLWPWPQHLWNPKDRRRDLARAGALIAAEIDRLDRVSSQ